MSRGPGKVQRSILKALEEAGRDDLVTVEQLAIWAWGLRALEPMPPAHRESVRRALMTLERQGAVELFYVGTEAVGSETRRRHLAARRAPAPALPKPDPVSTTPQGADEMSVSQIMAELRRRGLLEGLETT